MRNRLKWLLGGVLALAIGGLAFAQVSTLFSFTLSGNETWAVANSGPGGSSFFTNVSQMRNTTGYQLQTVGGTTINTNLGTNNNAAKLLLSGTSITTWNIGLATNPYDGQLFEVACNGGTATTVSIAATSQTIVGTTFTTCGNGGAASQTAEWLFSLVNTTWNRVQ